MSQGIGKASSNYAGEIYKLVGIKKMLEVNQVDPKNVDSKTLFDTKELKRCYNNLMKKDEVGDKEIMGYLFKECVEVGKRIKAQGTAKGHIYSGLLI